MRTRLALVCTITSKNLPVLPSCLAHTIASISSFCPRNYSAFVPRSEDDFVISTVGRTPRDVCWDARRAGSSIQRTCLRRPWLDDWRLTGAQWRAPCMRTANRLVRSRTLSYVRSPSSRVLQARSVRTVRCRRGSGFLLCAIRCRTCEEHGWNARHDSTSWFLASFLSA